MLWEWDLEIGAFLEDRGGALEGLVRHDDLLVEETGWDAVDEIQGVLTPENGWNAAGSELGQSKETLALYLRRWWLVSVPRARGRQRC